MYNKYEIEKKKNYVVLNVTSLADILLYVMCMYIILHPGPLDAIEE
jgi:hypothetical protein